jgi:hypothetical protein
MAVRRKFDRQPPGRARVMHVKFADVYPSTVAILVREIVNAVNFEVNS